MSTTLPDTLMELHRLLQRYRSEQRRSTANSIDAVRGRGRVISLLHRTGPISQKEMAYLLGVTQHELGDMLVRLERAGFLARASQDGDNSPVIVSLTEKGEHTHYDEDTFTEIFDVLSAKEQLQMEEYMDRLCRRICELLDWREEPVMFPPSARIGPKRPPNIVSGGQGAFERQPQKPAGPTPEQRWRDRIQHTSREDLCRQKPPKPRTPKKPDYDGDGDK